MPRHGFSRYANPSAFSPVPKELFARLLERFRDACVECGLDPRSLDDSAESDRLLWELFNTHAAKLPVELLAAMYRIDDLADDAGHSLITNAAFSRGVGLSLALIGLDPRRLAILAWLDHPEVFDVAHGKGVVQNTKAFRLFGSKHPRRAQMPGGDRLGELAAALATRFPSAGGALYTRIRPYEEHDQLCFVVSHPSHLLAAHQERTGFAHEIGSTFRVSSGGTSPPGPAGDPWPGR